MAADLLAGIAGRVRLSGHLLLPVLLVACASNLLVTLPPYDATRVARATAPAPKATVRVEPVRDARRDVTGSLIGERWALNKSMGKIEMSPLPVEMIGQLLRAELRMLGHSSVSAGEELTLSARLTKFEVLAPSTALYWDVNGAIEVDLVVAGRDGTKQNVRYETTCTDRTYSSPSKSLMTKVVSTCLANLGTKVREDPALARIPLAR